MINIDAREVLQFEALVTVIVIGLGIWALAKMSKIWKEIKKDAKNRTDFHR